MNARLLCLIALLAAGPLFGQSYFGSNPNGLGLRHYNPSIRGIGMGATGLASSDSLSLNNYVIAQWRNTRDTRATFMLLYQRNNATIGDTKFTTATGEFGGVNLAVPLVKHKWLFGVTLQPYTSLDYNYVSEFATDSISYVQSSITDGSISRAQINLVWAPVPALGLAVHTNYYFGTIKDRFEFRFSGNASLRDASHSIDYRPSGVGIGFSGDLKIGKVAKLAGFIDLEPSLNLTVSYEEAEIIAPQQRPRNLNTIPMHYGLGGSLNFGDRYVATADYTYQQWSKVLKQDTGNFEDWYHAGIGFERQGKKARKAGFWNRIDLRTGFSRRQLGYMFEGESVSETAFHFGLGLPFTGRLNRFDISFVAGTRGDSNKNLAQERFYNINLSASLGELWFRRIR